MCFREICFFVQRSFLKSTADREERLVSRYSAALCFMGFRGVPVLRLKVFDINLAVKQDQLEHFLDNSLASGFFCLQLLVSYRLSFIGTKGTKAPHESPTFRPEVSQRSVAMAAAASAAACAEQERLLKLAQEQQSQ